MRRDIIQQSELWEIARRLVGFNTVSAGSNVQAAEYISNFLEENGFTVRLVRETVEDIEKASVLAWAGPEEPGGLILSGHIDSVPFEGQPGWTGDALVMRTDGERIVGRGVADMKVFLAQAMLAGKEIGPEKLKRPLVYIFTCDEELAGQGAGRLIKVLPDLFRGYPLPEVALIGEPTGFEIFPANKGYAVFDIVARGKGGHSSAPHRGLNAIEKMAEVIGLLAEMNRAFEQRVSAENAALFPEFPATVFNSGVITGGLAANMIAETCRLTTSIRIAPGDEVETILAELRERIENRVTGPMRAAVPESSITIEHLIAAPAMKSPTDNAFCRLLCRVMGRRADIGAPYATDGGQFQRLGIHSYICGPGLLAEAHQPDESLPARHFLDGLEKVKEIVYAWCVHTA